VDEHLHPAVRDVAAGGAVSAGVGAAVLAAALTVDPPGVVLLAAGLAIAIVGVMAPLRMPGTVREILTELRAAPAARVDEGLSRAVWWSLPLSAVGLGLSAALSVPLVACGAALLGSGAWEVAHAWWLRRWERLNGRRLLYRAAFRFAGTNGRVLGRGWFDPANFVASD
jgi:hypothetical protein